MQRLKQKYSGWLRALGLTALFYGAGCGYQLSVGQNSLPKDVQSVFIELLTNRSRDVLIDKELTAALRREFHQQRQLRVVDRLEEADAILTGVVRTLDNRVVSVNRKDEVLQYQAHLIVDMNLRRREPDEVLWRVQGQNLTEIYSASRGAVVTTTPEFKTGSLNLNDLRAFTDAQLTETLRNDTRERLAVKFARELYQRMMERF